MTADSARKVARLYDTLAVALIEGQSPTAASAILAELVSAAADESGATMTTLQIRPDTIFRDRFAQIGVRMSGVGDVVTLVNLLEALEGHETLLSVRELSVSQSDPAAPEAKPETLRFHVLVEALAVTQRSSAIHSTGAK